MTGTEMRRRTTCRDRVLAALVEAGAAGVTNVELTRPEMGGLRAMGRIHELQRDWEIRVVRERGGIWRCTLVGRREPRQVALWGAA